MSLWVSTPIPTSGVCRESDCVRSGHDLALRWWWGAAISGEDGQDCDGASRPGSHQVASLPSWSAPAGQVDRSHRRQQPKGVGRSHEGSDPDSCLGLPRYSQWLDRRMVSGGLDTSGPCKTPSSQVAWRRSRRFRLLMQLPGLEGNPAAGSDLGPGTGGRMPHTQGRGLNIASWFGIQRVTLPSSPAQRGDFPFLT